MEALKVFSDIKRSKSLLNSTYKKFKDSTKFTPVIAIELEFFFIPKNNKTITSEEKLEEMTDSISLIAKNHGVTIGNLSRETGNLQYEINILHSEDIIAVIEDILRIKNIISDIASKYNFTASFDAKPYGDNDVGSGLHVHISLLNGRGENCFVKTNNEENPILLNSIGGLLLFLPASIPFFVGNPGDFSRYKAKFIIPKEELRYRCNATNAPINISWGTNNRTTAIRIPDAHQDPASRRIEHRVPACNANPYLVITAILFAIEYGITNNVTPQERTWGNAFDEQYHLKTLPLNLNDAIKLYESSELQKYLSDIK